MKVALGIIIPFLGTTLGAALVFLFKNKMHTLVEKFLLGFASGVMIAASIWSLLIPSINMSSDMGNFSWVPACVGFVIGMLFLLVLDSVVPHMHLSNKRDEGIKSKMKKEMKFFFAVTLHNVPEGLAVGVVLAGFLANDALITLAGALVLSVGIAIQNIPEGTIVSLNLLSEGESKKKSFLFGFLSGAVEPIAALLAIAFTKLVNGALPYLLSFAAGVMIYVVVDELIPDAQEGKHSNIATIGVTVGFALMMVLDIAMG